MSVLTDRIIKGISFRLHTILTLQKSTIWLCLYLRYDYVSPHNQFNFPINLHFSNPCKKYIVLVLIFLIKVKGIKVLIFLSPRLKGTEGSYINMCGGRRMQNSAAISQTSVIVLNGLSSDSLGWHFGFWTGF